MKIAFIHDWFSTNGGSEKVVKAILESIGNADVYCLIDFFSKEDRDFILKGISTKQSFLQQLPFCKKYYRNYLPFFPKAIESFDLSGYDLIISSSSSVAKNVKVSKNQIHISYCHSPMRYVWDLKNQYLEETPTAIKRKIKEKVFDKLRTWDEHSSDGVTHFIANSKFVSKRIKKNYNRESTIIYPPVDTNYFTPEKDQNPNNYFIVISRLVGYKKVGLIAKAFKNLPEHNLIIIGDGPESKKLPNASNIKYLGHIARNEMRSYLRNSRALLLAAVEDFGISSLEAQSCGIPVIALRKGGYLETVVENKTGLFFENQEVSDIVDAVKKFEILEHSFSPEEIRNHSLQFGEEIFKKKFLTELNTIIKEHGGQHVFK